MLTNPRTTIYASGERDAMHSNLMHAIKEVLGDSVTPEIEHGWDEAVLGLAEICINAEEDLYNGAEKRKGGWRYEREFLVSDKTPVAKNTVSFQFTAVDGYKGGFDFEPGQYLTLRIPQLSAPRYYTITSRPGESPFEITTRLVKVKEYSTFMHETVKVGDKVVLGAPMGILVPPGESEKKQMFLISAGIGKTPMLAFLRSLSPDRFAGGIHVEKSKEREAFPKCFGRLPCFKFHGLVQGQRIRNNLRRKLLILQEGMWISFSVVEPRSWQPSTLKHLGCNSINAELFGTGDLESNQA